MASNTFIIFILYCASLNVLGANSKKVLCSYDDEECLTKSTKAIFPIIVAGRPGEVEASDPLHLDEIILEVPDLKYVLWNATMSGLQECTVKDVKVNKEKVFFKYYIWCPSLIIESDYEANGQFDGIPVNGKGTSKISYSKYHIWLLGYYSKHNDDAGDLHTQITKFNLDLNAEEVTQDYKGLCFGQKEHDAASAEENLKQLEKRIREPLLHNFLQKYVNNLNTFLKIVAIKDIHYELVEDC